MELAAVNAMADHECVVLGIGMRAQAKAAALQSLWIQAGLGLPALTRFCAVAVLDGKEGSPALGEWVTQLPFHVAILPVAAHALPGQPVVTRSERLLRRYGTGSVAEAVALSAAAPAPTLLLSRRVADDGSATLAAALRHRQSGQIYRCLAAGCAPAATESQGVTA